MSLQRFSKILGEPAHFFLTDWMPTACDSLALFCLVLPHVTANWRFKFPPGQQSEFKLQQRFLNSPDDALLSISSTLGCRFTQFENHCTKQTIMNQNGVMKKTIFLIAIYKPRPEIFFNNDFDVLKLHTRIVYYNSM